MSVFLVGLFLTFTVGVPLHKHYCGTKLYSAGIVPKDCCCENTAEQPDDCCSTESDYFNIDQQYEQVAPQKVKLELPKLIIFAPTYAVPNESFVDEVRDTAIIDQDIPLGKIPLYKLFQEFKIYG